MITMECVKLAGKKKVEDPWICRGYHDPQHECFHIIGGVCSSEYMKKNRIRGLKCRQCERFNMDIPAESTYIYG